ncbi:MAG: hypothetical protein ACR2MX_02915 [Cyclobacteriaceae bacterium]
MGLLLTFIAILLSITTLWLGLAYTLITGLFTFRFRDINDYFFDIAVSIDQLGNVIMRDLFNQILITSSSQHKFGHEDEVISSVLGKNQIDQTLSGLGRVIVRILDYIDPDHSLNSIEHRKKIS